MQDFRNLKVWGKGHELTLLVYRLSKSFPKEELFCPTQQLRRSSSSIPTNIAEGCGRGSNADFARFLWIANGSAKEVDYQLILARDLGYLNESDYQVARNLVIEVMRMLSGLIQTVTQV